MTPGIYADMSHLDYLEASGWVSSSELKRHLPEHYKPFTGSPAADIGSVLHARFTGDTTPVETVDAATWQGKAAKEQWVNAQSAGSYAILAGDTPAIDGMEQALRSHRVASDLLVKADGAWEVSVFSEPDGVPSRCRFDRLLDAGVAVDLKTTKEPPSLKDLQRAVVNYGYDLQQVHYDSVASWADIDLREFKFIFCQSIPPYYVTVVDLDEAFRERGLALRDLALRRYLHPQMEDTYPGEREPVTLTCPRYAEL